LFVKEIGRLRVVKYINHLIVLSRLASKVNCKSLIDFDKTGIERIVGIINTSRWEDSTKHDYKSALKKYFQWLKAFGRKFLYFCRRISCYHTVVIKPFL